MFCGCVGSVRGGDVKVLIVMVVVVVVCVCVWIRGVKEQGRRPQLKDRLSNTNADRWSL